MRKTGLIVAACLAVGAWLAPPAQADPILDFGKIAPRSRVMTGQDRGQKLDVKAMRVDAASLFLFVDSPSRAGRFAADVAPGVWFDGESGRRVGQVMVEGSRRYAGGAGGSGGSLALSGSVERVATPRTAVSSKTSSAKGPKPSTKTSKPGASGGSSSRSSGSGGSFVGTTTTMLDNHLGAPNGVPYVGDFDASFAGTAALAGGAAANALNGEVSASPVPEPGTMLLLGTGLLGLAAAARRRLT